MMKLQVMEDLADIYGDLYTWDNVIISGTHTHAAPGGVGGTALVSLTTFGWIEENFDAIVGGIVESIRIAHDNLEPGDITAAFGEVTGGNINRSPSAYDRDPLEEQEQYKENTDTEMTLLKFVTDRGEEIGAINWYPVHLTSMNNTNKLVSGDNKGYASLLMEEDMNPGQLPGQGKFVAAFGQSNLGDVSPNTVGATCEDGITPCDYMTSTCNGLTEGCIAKGAIGSDWDNFKSTEIIARAQYDTATELYRTASIPVRASGVAFRHKWVNMQEVTVEPRWSTTGREESTCIAAMGYSFAAGTTDGPGQFDFTQGQNTSNPFWDLVSSFLAVPSEETRACHQPKPILLPVGTTSGLIGPIAWVPTTLPMQLVRVGNVYMIAYPGELSTMAGRRLKSTIRNSLPAGDRESAIIVICGLSNSYSHYTVTYEEYQAQRYEGASTLYGPHTLAAAQQNFNELSTSMQTGEPIVSDREPLDLRNSTITLRLPVVQDLVPAGTQFGDVVEDVLPEYKIGEIASATFWGGNPRNDLRTEGSYLMVQRNNAGTWEDVCNDGCWETKFHWKRIEEYSQHVTVEWDTTRFRAGTYRLTTAGSSKSIFGFLTPYTGTSSTFQLVA